MIDKRIIEAYARLKSCKGGAEQLLEEIICEQLGVTQDDLNFFDKHVSIVANEAANGDYIAYCEQIFQKNMNLENEIVSYETRKENKTMRIYAGTEDFVDFFEKIVQILNLDIAYQVEDCDGELEIVIKGE